MNYEEFIKSKQVKHENTGFSVSKAELNKYAFDWQKDVILWALLKGKACLFLDTGLGKTICQLDWADKVCKHTGGKVLVVAYLTVAQQTAREAEKFEIPVTLCRTQADVRDGINITNYEMLEHFDSEEFVGVVLDESSILKNYMGTTKQTIIKMFKDTPYKLACTATPSPNNQMEILNQAEYLGVMKSHEALAIWFINDTSQSGNYQLKGHAVKSFWKWVSSWAVCISKPSEIGYSDEGYNLPQLIEKEIVIPIDETSTDVSSGLFRTIETSATAFHTEKRITAEQRAMRCAEIVSSKPNEQFVIWCCTDYEADLLKKYIPEAVEVRGSQKAEDKEKAAKDFIDGKIKIMISKVKIFGYGLNFQNCHNTIFCGLDYSYESYYQAVRRFWRFGQNKPVTVWIVIGSTEQRILETVKRKEKQHSEMKLAMYQKIKDFQNCELKQREFKLNISNGPVLIPKWIGV